MVYSKILTEVCSRASYVVFEGLKLLLIKKEKKIEKILKTNLEIHDRIHLKEDHIICLI